MNSDKRPRLHPIQWLAALSVVGFSGVGIAALTGAIPSAVGHQEIQKESRMAAAEASTAAAEPVAPARPARPAPKASQPSEPTSTAPACRQCGVIESVQAVQVDGQGSGAGVIAGGVVGGVLGNQVGKGSGHDLATIGGAVLGGIAGNQIEKKVRTGTAYDVAVRMDDGRREVLRLASLPPYRTGDRVSVGGGALQAPPTRGS
ncbi:MAG: glycine zipper 2TM domain-containing protein [Rhodocyclaceae bacterium]|nr:glycine zipper 2TM domain-containing protein [Rhodocyclaceae bacterium]